MYTNTTPIIVFQGNQSGKPESNQHSIYFRDFQLEARKLNTAIGISTEALQDVSQQCLNAMREMLAEFRFLVQERNYVKDASKQATCNVANNPCFDENNTYANNIFGIAHN